MTDDHLALMGNRIRDARLLKGWTVERAARQADISRTTWGRLEEGLGVQDVKRAAVLRVLELDHNGEPLTPEEPRTVRADRRLDRFSDEELAAEVLRRMQRSEIEKIGSRGWTEPEVASLLGEGQRLADAARELGETPRGRQRRADHDSAGEPPVDNPDDMEPR